MKRRGLALAILSLALYGALSLVGAELALLLAVIGTVTTGVCWWAHGLLSAGPSLPRSRSLGGRSAGSDAAAIGAMAAVTTTSAPVDCSSSAGGFSADCGGSF